MEVIVLAIHLVICIGLIGLVLLQRSEGGALGMGGGGGSLMSGRGAADALAKLTSVAGGLFLLTSISLTVLAGATSNSNERSVFDMIAPLDTSAPETPAPADPLENLLSPSAAPEAAAPPAAETSALVVAPAPAAASERAGPVQRATTPPPAAVNQPATARPAAAPVQNTPRPAASASQPRTTTTNAPSNSGAAAQPAPLTPAEVAPVPAESGETQSGVDVVRRERAGPDQ